MKKRIALVLFGCLAAIGMAQDRYVKGKVSDGRNPMENVNIQIVDKDLTTTTDVEGKYEIVVETGDKIQYSYTGMKTITIRVEDVTRTLNPVMVPDVEELEEVTVEASKRRSQSDLKEDYVLNKSIIRTAWGYLDAERAAGNIRILSEEEINPVSLCVLDLLRNRFAGIRVIGNCISGAQTSAIGTITNSATLGGAVFIRGGGSLSSANPAIFDVDGQIFTDVPIWIDVNNIKRLAILGNLATSAPYGNIAAGGVVVINTISGSIRQGQIVDRARLRNNYVKEPVLTRADVLENGPSYLKELEASDSFESAKLIFEKYKGPFSNSPYFHIDAYRYFVDQWNETDFADGILDSGSGLFENNAVLLKALAYTFQEQGRFDKANDTFKEVFVLRPNYAQSYLDIADSYRDVKEPRQAASIYARYDYLLQEGFMEEDTLGFGPVINREYNNLLALERSAVVRGRKAQKVFVGKEDFEGTRLVFEWNDGEAEFDLQFVNPENQYFKWKHTLADNSALIEREKDFGYNVMEELVDGSLPGLWKVNVNYFGNKSLTPTYLKATVYHDYGSRSQRKEVKVFKLSVKNINQELFTLNVNGTIATQN